ncbi:hypothetical protein TNCV_1171501 [Trichonephila clavipes]|nr:hypothetical protein TNCV_1171501 [Trichonephila clavipes]
MKTAFHRKDLPSLYDLKCHPFGVVVSYAGCCVVGPGVRKGALRVRKFGRRKTENKSYNELPQRLASRGGSISALKRLKTEMRSPTESEKLDAAMNMI